MKFKIDENMPGEAASLLREAGHEGSTVADENLGGGADQLLAERIRKEKRALLTLDLDFSDIRAYPPNEYSGIVVFRAKRQDKHVVLDLVRRFLPLLQTERLTGSLWIVEADGIRIREGTGIQDLGL